MRACVLCKYCYIKPIGFFFVYIFSISIFYMSRYLTYTYVVACRYKPLLIILFFFFLFLTSTADQLDAIRVMTVCGSASGQATTGGRRIWRMVTSGTTIWRGTCARYLLCWVACARASWGLDALLGVVFILSSAFNRRRCAVRRAHRVSAGRLYTYKTQRARPRISLYCLFK